MSSTGTVLTAHSVQIMVDGVVEVALQNQQSGGWAYFWRSQGDAMWRSRSLVIGALWQGVVSPGAELSVGECLTTTILRPQF